jgi:DNA-binding transcriptional MerR regulator
MVESMAVETGYRKGFYRMGEVCSLTGLESHVLRYWEQEFPQLRPRKSRGGQRMYRPDDIELILRIRDLLHQEGYTIAGACRRLRAESPGAGEPDATTRLEETRLEIDAMLTLLEANDKL